MIKNSLTNPNSPHPCHFLCRKDEKAPVFVVSDVYRRHLIQVLSSNRKYRREGLRDFHPCLGWRIFSF